MSGLIGQTIDTYRVLGVLGNGGMGIVYKAEDTTLDRPVALKMMDARFANDEMFLKRFQSEARALAKLQHPGIVSIYALRETSQGFLIAMEFVDGITLADRLRQSGAMSPDACIRIFSQILTALDHAHESGIVHRDIKPGNIMLTADERVKVTDFGLAKIQQTSAMTMTMGTAGTLYYMSPEQVRGLANVDRRGDIYSLGITLYEALTGCVPFGEDVTDFSIRKAIVDGEIPSLEKVKPDLPRGLAQVVMKSIARDPEKRYQTAAEMRLALEDVNPGAAPSPRPPAETVFAPDSAGPTKTRSKLLIPALAVAIVVCAVAAYFLWPAGANRTAEDPAIAAQQTARSADVPARSATPVDSGTETETPERGGTPPRQLNTGPSDPDPRRTQAAGSDRNGDPPVRTSPDPPTVTPINTAELGRLTVAVFPSAKVTVEGVTRSAEAGQSASFEVPAGNRSITVTHPSYGTKRFNAAIAAGTTQSVSYYFEQTITVLVRPQYGNISVNGEDLGLYSSKVLTKGPGRYNINVMKDGKIIESVTLNGKAVAAGPQTITVEAGEQKRDYRLIFTLKDKQ